MSLYILIKEAADIDDGAIGLGAVTYGLKERLDRDESVE